MNHCAIQQKNFAARDEIWGRSVEKETVVCPKPRRLGLIHTTLYEPSAVRPLRWHVSHQQEVNDMKAGNELLDIIHAKGGVDQSIPNIASSPPFFSGSPPSRVSNPLIQDARFGDEKFTPVSPRAIPTPSGLAPSPTSTRKGVVSGQILATTRLSGSRVSTALTGIAATAASLPWLRVLFYKTSSKSN